jgi:DNA-binding GntR family transcriptional regulator
MSEDGLVSKSDVGSVLLPAPRRVLADEVADSIREAIFSGQIDLGQRLVEEELAKMLSVSRGPVREALVRLSQEGLVSLERHRGASVAHISLDDLHEIYSLRLSLERLAVEWLCQRSQPSDFARLEAVLDNFDRLPRSPVRSAVAALDVAFHDAIFLAAHHRRLYQAWLGLRSQIFLYLTLRGALRTDYAITWKGDHEELLSVLKARKKAPAVRFIEAHIAGSYQRALKASGEGSG